jgi:hypothetical protein
MSFDEAGKEVIAMKRAVALYILVAAVGLAWAAGARADCCEAPDNGTGTVLFPADCPYAHPSEPMVVTDGLPPGTSIVFDGPLAYFSNVNITPGGVLGGEICTFEAFFEWTVSGTGMLMGYNRSIYMPVEGEIHIAPRVPGDSVQTFDAVIYGLQGELFGDPDFCMLRLEAGQYYGLPSPGRTMLTELPSGDFAVDSFFDITYRIEYEGCPGSPLDGYAGVDEKRVPRTTCNDFYLVNWCRLQWPHAVHVPPGTSLTVYGRFYIPGVTDQSTGNDESPGRIRGQAGYGPPGTDPSAGGWTWFEAHPNPDWDGSAWGEPDNDEYMADITAPMVSGDYDFCVRFSGDLGHTWLYGDIDTGLPGEDGSENGYQPANAGDLTVEDVCCVAPDNGTGTVDFPADCDYDHAGAPMLIVNGLPAGTTIELAGPLTGFYNVSSSPGGGLGGEICTFDAYLDLTVSGTGSLLGFNRHLYVPASGVIHIGPRTPGDPQQFFIASLDSLHAQLFGDPDFCEFALRAGDAYGLPCPGQTLLTELPSGDFAVESFFDVTYDLDFEGCPGSQLDGYAGTTRRSVPRTTCTDFYSLDWCRLQWPLTIATYAGTDVVVYGRFYIAGLTDRSQYNDLAPGRVRGQVGYGPAGSDPSTAAATWTWIEATPNPGWDGMVYGEPDNDEYWATLTTPAVPGVYDYCYRFSGDAGLTWVYGDKNTGLPGEDGSENGYQPANAGKMTVWGICCAAPDNGSGTIDFPPDCEYDNEREPMFIIDGLPPGTTIELWGPLTDFYNVVNVPGGGLGGEICTFDAYFNWTVEGTGDLAGFNRVLWVPVSGEIHIAPRNPGDPVQTFDALIYTLQGQLFGDPDFCTLTVHAGSGFGLPCPGGAQLTGLPNGDFAVDSFFDVTYSIEFEGCPGSIIDGYAGTTTALTMKATCSDNAAAERDKPAPESLKGIRLDPGVPNPFPSSTTIAYAIPAASHVSLRVYDAAGRLVSVLVDGMRDAGEHRVYWDGTDSGRRPAASGVYFCRLTAGSSTATQRIVLLR